MPVQHLTRISSIVLLPVALIALVTAASASAQRKTAAPAVGPLAVGTLFTRASNGTLGRHFCTGTVVDSPKGDVVVTAAHCITDQPPGSIAFVPGYHNGKVPIGVWVVEKVFVDSAWTTSLDPDHDFAFLVVSRSDSQSRLQALTGGMRLGSGEVPRRSASVTGYPSSSETAIACRNVLLRFSSTQLEFDCDGYTNGTSGSAVVVDADAATGLGTVVGVIGGYQQGGNTPSVSYAAAFNATTKALCQQALRAP